MPRGRKIWRNFNVGQKKNYKIEKTLGISKNSCKKLKIADTALGKWWQNHPWQIFEFGVHFCQNVVDFFVRNDFLSKSCHFLTKIRRLCSSKSRDPVSDPFLIKKRWFLVLDDPPPDEAQERQKWTPKDNFFLFQDAVFQKSRTLYISGK